ncbi:hypothetical protein P3T36_002390 [Kitasatospora sp. MAP12-15]|uniref:hypothetical protein n=1 Tax=unclassified Kitasatospora TaxID=2633591 RepID=UPI0024763A2F|nr:hypothetical protein [Kitasatospora sp. MAP12-44]MDH6108689.1 hypothetical protein [Kitasatospora sp. MAP12-44]
MSSLRVRLTTTAAAVTLAAVPLALVTAPAATARAATWVPQATATCSQAYLPLPDPTCTPGALNPSVTQSTIDSTICVSGWTTTVRPPTSYTNRLKAQGIIAYGYSDTNMSDYEEDHFIPLELGGSPTSPLNLWPEPHANVGGGTSYSKDSVENALKRAVCAGQVDLAPAQQAIAANWTTALATLGLS